LRYRCAFLLTQMFPQDLLASILHIKVFTKTK